MDVRNKITVLNEITPYFRLLTAFESDNFRQQNWRYTVWSVFYVFGASMIILLLPTMIALAIWYLIENDVELIAFVATLPLLVSILQLELTFIALIWKNRRIIETINQLQRLVDERESFSPFFSLFQFPLRTLTHEDLTD